MLSKQAAAFAAAAIVISRNPFERREQIDKIDRLVFFTTVQPPRVADILDALGEQRSKEELKKQFTCVDNAYTLIGEHGPSDKEDDLWRDRSMYDQMRLCKPFQFITRSPS